MLPQPAVHNISYINLREKKAQTLHIFRIKNQRKKVWGKERGKKEALTTHSVTIHGKFTMGGQFYLSLVLQVWHLTCIGKQSGTELSLALKQIQTTRLRHQLPIYSLSQDLAIQQHIIKILDSNYLFVNAILLLTPYSLFNNGSQRETDPWYFRYY